MFSLPTRATWAGAKLMSYLVAFGESVALLSFILAFRLVWELLRQNGRLLLRIEALEKRLEEITESRKQKAEIDQEPAPGNDDERTERFSNHSLANSKIKRDGLKAGTVAPEFRLPRVEGGELALSDLRGRLVLLVFSSPHCGPCNVLAPKLEKFYRSQRGNSRLRRSLARLMRRRSGPALAAPGEGAGSVPDFELVMISRESVEDNRAKVKEHGLTFPVVLQKQWEVSRDYAFFATPVAYLISESGVTAADVGAGVEGVLNLMARVQQMRRRTKPALSDTKDGLDTFRHLSSIANT